MDNVKYEIIGDDMQFVRVELDNNESVVAESGALLFMDQGVKMSTIFGDGSKKNSSKGFMGKVVAAGKRALTGESLFMTKFDYNGSGKGEVAFGAPYPGKIVAVNLSEYGNTITCQKDAFLCASTGTEVTIAFQKKLGVGFFGGEGFIMQKLNGTEHAFLHAGGTIYKRELTEGETLRVDTGCLVALTDSVQYEVELVGGVKNTLFGGEGLFFATLKGPGTVWIQSLPFARLADKILSISNKSNTSSGGGEGSVLGGLGKLIDGR